jgi:hypothetical protein
VEVYERRRLVLRGPDEGRFYRLAGLCGQQGVLRRGVIVDLLADDEYLQFRLLSGLPLHNIALSS